MSFTLAKGFAQNARFFSETELYFTVPPSLKGKGDRGKGFQSMTLDSFSIRFDLRRKRPAVGETDDIPRASGFVEVNQTLIPAPAKA